MGRYFPFIASSSVQTLNAACGWFSGSTDTDDRKTSNRKTIHCFVKWIEEEYGSAVANKVFEEGGVLHSRMKADADLTSGLVKRTIEDARRLSVSAEFVNSDWAAGQVPTAANPVEAGLRKEFESLWNEGMPRVSRQLRLAWKGKSLFRAAWRMGASERRLDNKQTMVQFMDYLKSKGISDDVLLFIWKKHFERTSARETRI